MRYTILGGGLSAISLAYFLQNRDDITEINIIEKDSVAGGLCRSYEIEGITYDVGPHIIFSKDLEVLDLMKGLLGENINKLRRSNRILHKGRFVQFPFENDLSKLPKEDLDYCVNTFMNNPYENYEAKNMLQFFLKTFGEGITNTYLRPYNEKIWKFDPSFMDTQMVERIPKPTKEDILKSSEGETIEGHLHQLYFTYPKSGGIESLLQAFILKLGEKVKIHTNNEVLQVSKSKEEFVVKTSQGEFVSDEVVSTIPLNKLVQVYETSTLTEVASAAGNLKYNSILIGVVNVKKDFAGDNIAFMIADREVKFHRLSKVDYWGENYSKPDSVTYMTEITYRKGDLIDKASDEEVMTQIILGLQKIDFIESESDINFTDIRRFEYAYVIYDLNHRQNVDLIKEYFAQEGISLNGRFGSFEYLNMDAVIRQSLELSKTI